MSTVMIPCTVAATLTADLTYNPSVHVQTVEIDRVGTDMIEMSTHNFVKWYLRLSDLLNLTWNMRDISGVGFETDISDTSANFNNIFALARSGDHASSTVNAPVWNSTGASFASDGLLVTEASGAGVKFASSSLTMAIPLTNDTPAYGASATDGSAAYIGKTNVTYDRVLFDSDAAGSIAGSSGNVHTATATSTTWSFDDSTINLQVSWASGNSSSESEYDASMSYWGRSEIMVMATAGANINVTKPYNDAAADFIQIGMDASNGSAGNTSTFASGNTVVGNTSQNWNSGVNDSGLIDPLATNSMTSGSADDVTDSIDYAAYFSDYTATHNNSHGTNARRNLINVSISKPTITVSQEGFTRGLQQAINQLTVTQDVSNTQSLRAAVTQSFTDGTIKGFQSGLKKDVGAPGLVGTYQVGDVSMSLPVTVAGQIRKLSSATVTGNESAASITASDDETGSYHKMVYLTPIIEIVSDTFYHTQGYTYHSGIV